MLELSCRPASAEFWKNIKKRPANQHLGQHCRQDANFVAYRLHQSMESILLYRIAPTAVDVDWLYIIEFANEVPIINSRA